MDRKIEIYLRPSGERVLMNIYVPVELTERLFEALRAGSFEASNVPMAFEMSVQPQWLTEPDSEHGGGSPHIRVPIAAINLIRSD
jgi:hypothetical protein